MNENRIEQGPERIPIKEEVLSLINARVERGQTISVIQELSDAQGLYALEARVEAENAHEETRYEYIRAGSHPSGHASAESVIFIAYYRDGQPVGGDTIAKYRPETGQWETIE